MIPIFLLFFHFLSLSLPLSSLPPPHSSSCFSLFYLPPSRRRNAQPSGIDSSNLGTSSFMDWRTWEMFDAPCVLSTKFRSSSERLMLHVKGFEDPWTWDHKSSSRESTVAIYCCKVSWTTIVWLSNWACRAFFHFLPSHLVVDSGIDVKFGVNLVMDGEWGFGSSGSGGDWRGQVVVPELFYHETLDNFNYSLILYYTKYKVEQYIN